MSNSEDSGRVRVAMLPKWGAYIFQRECPSGGIVKVTMDNYGEADEELWFAHGPKGEDVGPYGSRIEAMEWAERLWITPVGDE